MAKNKGSRIIITLECQCKVTDNSKKRKAGLFRYTTTKNRRNTPERIEIQKFCPNCNLHTKFKEIK